MRNLLKYLFIIILTVTSQAWGVQVSSGEMATASQWILTNFTGTNPTFPFSFTYGGVPSSTFLPTWNFQRLDVQLDAARTQHTLTFTDPATGLQVRCVAVEYSDFPVVEWTLYFTNNGAAATPLVQNIYGLDTTFQRGAQGEFSLHENNGSQASATDFQPFTYPLGPGATFQLAGFGGRPTNIDLSYFNVEWSGQGAVVVVGWPGQWVSYFTRDQQTGLHIRAGQQTTNFILMPGETVRSPLSVVQFWQGDWIRGQNIWRAWMVAHNLPRPGGSLPPPQTAASTSGQTNNMQTATEQFEDTYIGLYAQRGLAIDHWWMDAGWYPDNDNWVNTGTWWPDPARFPNGITAVSNTAHAAGLKTILWSEPERVTAGSWLYQNLGNPGAWQWVSSYFSQLLTTQGIDVYRQDFNIDPLYFWRANDTLNRQGITENFYVQGYLAYWDKLLSDHPNLMIDSCASGGRRNDLETLRRSVPLWRSDYSTDPEGMQNQTYGLALWFPYFGTAANPFDAYQFRSQMTPAVVIGPDVSVANYPYTIANTLMAEWRQVSPYYFGDYYPLTPYLPEVSSSSGSLKMEGPTFGGVRRFRLFAPGAQSRAALRLEWTLVLVMAGVIVLTAWRRRLRWSLGLALMMMALLWVACGGRGPTSTQIVGGGTPITYTYASFVAWQFDRSDLGAGMVQVFRRDKTSVNSAQLKLNGLDATASYTVTNLDAPTPITMSGSDLMNTGLPVTLGLMPSAAIFVYQIIR